VLTLRIIDWDLENTLETLALAARCAREAAAERRLGDLRLSAEGALTAADVLRDQLSEFDDAELSAFFQVRVRVSSAVRALGEAGKVAGALLNEAEEKGRSLSALRDSCVDLALAGQWAGRAAERLREAVLG
jgi:hypothetical protein